MCARFELSAVRTACTTSGEVGEVVVVARVTRRCKHHLPRGRYGRCSMLPLHVASRGLAPARLLQCFETCAASFGRQLEDGRQVLGREHHEAALQRADRRSVCSILQNATWQVGGRLQHSRAGYRCPVPTGSPWRPPHAGAQPGTMCGVRSAAGRAILQRRSAEFCRIRHLAAAWRAGRGCRAGWGAR